MKQTYFIIIFMLSISVYSQNKRVLIHGFIVNDSLQIDNVNILNKTSHKGTVSNVKGEFYIFAKENDILQFSDIQYLTKYIHLSAKHIKSKKLLIHLLEKTNELQEVVVQNMAKSLGLPNADKKPLKPIERKINYIEKGGTIDKLYAWVSGDKKRIKTLKKHLDEDAQLSENKLNIQLIRNHFNDDFFIQNLKLNKENIDGLISFCIPKGIVFVFEKERYLEVVDLLIQNKEAYLNSLK